MDIITGLSIHSVQIYYVKYIIIIVDKCVD